MHARIIWCCSKEICWSASWLQPAEVSLGEPYRAKLHAEPGSILGTRLIYADRVICHDLLSRSAGVLLYLRTAIRDVKTSFYLDVCWLTSLTSFKNLQSLQYVKETRSSLGELLNQAAGSKQASSRLFFTDHMRVLSTCCCLVIHASLPSNRWEISRHWSVVSGCALEAIQALCSTSWTRALEQGWYRIYWGGLLRVPLILGTERGLQTIKLIKAMTDRARPDESLWSSSCSKRSPTPRFKQIRDLQAGSSTTKSWNSVLTA